MRVKDPAAESPRGTIGLLHHEFVDITSFDWRGSAPTGTVVRGRALLVGY